MARAWLVAVGFALLVGVATASDVVQLTSDNFEKKVLQSSDYWLVEFYAPWCGHCKSLAPTWEELATKVKSVARIGAVDATVAKDLASKYGIQGFPTIKEFGKDKSNPADYQQARDLKALVAFVQENSKGFSVSAKIDTVKYKDMYDFVGSHRFLLVLPDKAKKAKAPKWFSTVATKVQAKHAASRFGLSYGPHAKKIRNRLGLAKSAHAILVGFTRDGQFASHVVAAPKAAGTFVREVLKGRVQDAAPAPSFPEPSRPKSRTPVKFSVLTPSNVEAKCLNVKGRMCVLLLGSSSPSSVDVVSEVARPLARAFRLDKLSFGYVAGGSDLSPVLRPAFGLPQLSEEANALQVVVVKTGKRKRFAVFDMKSSLTDASAVVGDLTAFLNDVMGGTVRFTKFQVPELPAVSTKPPRSAASRDQPPVDEELEL